jgi:3'-phosphoadenosine 5'-phosphosulfate sulfotransferase (PAPS reductase)/FAD synthetase
MANHCLTKRRGDWDEIVVVFANTGQEHEKTLEYIHACDKQYGLNVVWLEAVVNPEEGQGTKHRVVTFETAARGGGAF